MAVDSIKTDTPEESEASVLRETTKPDKANAKKITATRTEEAERLSTEKMTIYNATETKMQSEFPKTYQITESSEATTYDGKCGNSFNFDEGITDNKCENSYNSTEGITVDRKSESSYNAREFEEKEKLARKARELLMHFYNANKPKRQTRKRLVYTKDEESGSESEIPDDDAIDPYDIIDREFESRFGHKRRNNYSRAKRDRVPTKEQMFQGFCRKHETSGDIVLEKGNKKSVRVKFERCAKQISRNSNRKDHGERRKLNIEKKLKKWGIKRRGQIPVHMQESSEDEKPGRYHIHEDNVPSEMQDMLDFLMVLQGREVTPEDYEFLLKLDDLVPKKTVSDECLQRLREEIVDESHAEEICGICMDNYKIGEIRKILPCDHVFHGDCVGQWLSQSSTKCPLDGLEL